MQFSAKCLWNRVFYWPKIGIENIFQSQAKVSDAADQSPWSEACRFGTVTADLELDQIDQSIIPIGPLWNLIGKLWKTEA